MKSTTGINRNVIYGQLKSAIAQVCRRHVREIRAGHRLAEDLKLHSNKVTRLSSAINQKIGSLGTSISEEDIRSVSTVRELCGVVCARLRSASHKSGRQEPILSIVEWIFMTIGLIILVSFWAYVLVFA